MIKLYSMNEQEIYLNPFIIESVEENPHTVIYLTDGKTMVVRNDIEDIVNQCIEFYKQINIFPYKTPNNKD